MWWFGLVVACGPKHAETPIDREPSAHEQRVTAVSASKDLAALLSEETRRRVESAAQEGEPVDLIPVYDEAAARLAEVLEREEPESTARGREWLLVAEMVDARLDPSAAIERWLSAWHCPGKVDDQACIQAARRTLAGSSLVRTEVERAGRWTVDDFVVDAASEWVAARSLAWAAGMEQDFVNGLGMHDRLVFGPELMAHWKDQLEETDGKDPVPDPGSEEEEKAYTPKSCLDGNDPKKGPFGTCGAPSTNGNGASAASLMGTLGGLGSTPSGPDSGTGGEMGEDGEVGPDWELPEGCLPYSPLKENPTGTAGGVSPEPDPSSDEPKPKTQEEIDQERKELVDEVKQAKADVKTAKANYDATEKAAKSAKILREMAQQILDKVEKEAKANPGDEAAQKKVTDWQKTVTEKTQDLITATKNVIDAIKDLLFFMDEEKKAETELEDHKKKHDQNYDPEADGDLDDCTMAAAKGIIDCLVGPQAPTATSLLCSPALLLAMENAPILTGDAGFDGPTCTCEDVPDGGPDDSADASMLDIWNIVNPDPNPAD